MCDLNLCFSDNYKKIVPSQFNDALVGFGYSFSKIGYKAQDGNGMPYFAVGVVNNKVPDKNPSSSDAVVLFRTSSFCVNIKKECTSTYEMKKQTIDKNDKSEYHN